MMTDPYGDAVRELFAAPAHAGTLSLGTTALADDQGIRLEFSASVADSRISVLRFRAWGCPHVIAAAEWACRHFEGGPVSALEISPVARIMEDLAVPVEKTGRILVLEDAILSLGRSLKSLNKG